MYEADGVESNVATGCQAVEFLLWGQDLNGHGRGAGMRLAMDYAMGSDCMNGNCDCREEYLQASTDLLVSDSEWGTAQWADYGNARVRDGG